MDLWEVLPAVVGCLARYGHIVRMALGHTCSGNAHETGILQLGQVVRSAVTHSGAETADELVYHLGKGTLVGNLSHDALRHKFLDVLLHILEVTVLGAQLHGLERTHTTVGLELTSVEDDGLSGRLLHSGEERAGHDGVGTGGQSLDNVTRIAYTSVCDDGDTGALQSLGGHHDCRKLGHAHTGNDTGGAYRTGAYADPEPWRPHR